MMWLIPAPDRNQPPTKRSEWSYWNTILFVHQLDGALGYSLKFPADVKDGVLHAEKGDDRPTRLASTRRKILDDGAADCTRNGIVGAAQCG